MPAHRRILVQFAHPAIHKSRVNRALAAAAKEVAGITFNDLYESYPDLLIDVEREQELLLSHDVIVWQHPFYWYSAPAIVKEWCDLVLEYGFAYGPGGDRLGGKAWMHAISAGGPEEAYCGEGYNRFSLRQLLAPFDQTAHLCKMAFLPPFAVYGSLRLDPRTDIPRIAAEYGQILAGLRDPGHDLAKLGKLECMEADAFTITQRNDS